MRRQEKHLWFCFRLLHRTYRALCNPSSMQNDEDGRTTFSTFSQQMAVSCFLYVNQKLRMHDKYQVHSMFNVVLTHHPEHQNVVHLLQFENFFVQMALISSELKHIYYCNAMMMSIFVCIWQYLNSFKLPLQKHVFTFCLSKSKYGCFRLITNSSFPILSFTLHFHGSVEAVKRRHMANDFVSI